MARYDVAVHRGYANTWGRFTTPDPYLMSGGLTNPQGWNRYSYAGNDPLNFHDPEGLQRRAPGWIWQRVDEWTPEGWAGSWVLIADWGTDAVDDPDPEGGIGGGFSPTTIVKGDLTLHDVTSSGPKFDLLAKAFKNLVTNLYNDPDCLNWFAGGTHAPWILDAELLESVGTRLGVSSRIERNGNNAPGIAAVALASPAYDIVVNGQGAFFYGGDIPGIKQPLSASSDAGRVFILLHELAHVVGGLINENDVDSRMNEANNAVVWKHCEKTVTGKGN